MKKFDNLKDFLDLMHQKVMLKKDVYVFNCADGYYYDDENEATANFYTDSLFDMRALQRDLFLCSLDESFPKYEDEELHIVLDFVFDEDNDIEPIYDRLFIFYSK